MRMHDGAQVQPDSASCCVGMVGIEVAGHTTCASEPTTSGTPTFADSGEVWPAFTCEWAGLGRPTRSRGDGLR